MKKCHYLFFVLFLILPAHSSAEDFLGVPVIPHGKTIMKTDARLEFKTDRTHNEVVEFYKKAFIALPDIKFRDWPDDTYIEDDGKLPWHSVTISKGGEKGTRIIIVKDNWTWIIGTLVLRYIGVFVVLIILLIGMSISGALISRTVGKAGEKDAA